MGVCVYIHTNTCTHVHAAVAILGGFGVGVLAVEEVLHVEFRLLYVVDAVGDWLLAPVCVCVCV